MTTASTRSASASRSVRRARRGRWPRRRPRRSPAPSSASASTAARRPRRRLGPARARARSSAPGHGAGRPGGGERRRPGFGLGIAPASGRPSARAGRARAGRAGWRGSTTPPRPPSARRRRAVRRRRGTSSCPSRRAKRRSGASEPRPVDDGRSVLMGGAPHRRPAAHHGPLERAGRNGGTGRAPTARSARSCRCGCRRGPSSPAADGGSSTAAGRSRRSSSEPAGRRGSRPARQRTSSTSMLPSPAMRCWSSRTALSGARRPRNAPASCGPGQGQRVGTQPIGIGVEPHPPEAAGIVQPQAAAVVEPDHPPVPHRVVGRAAVGQPAEGPVGVDEQAAGHPEVDADVGLVGVDDEQLAAPPEGLDAGAGHGGVDAVTDDERIGALDRPEAPTDERFDGAARELDLQDLGHGVSVSHRSPSGTLAGVADILWIVIPVLACVGMLVPRPPHRAALGGQGRHPVPHDDPGDRRPGRHRRPAAGDALPHPARRHARRVPPRVWSRRRRRRSASRPSHRTRLGDGSSTCSTPSRPTPKDCGWPSASRPGAGSCRPSTGWSGSRREEAADRVGELVEVDQERVVAVG